MQWCCFITISLKVQYNYSWPNTSLTVSILGCSQIFHSATCMQWCHFISYTLCVINLTMSLSQVLLQVPRLLVGLRGTCSSVVLPVCSPFPPDVDPVAPPPRAGSWLILLNERTTVNSEWEVLLHRYITVLLSLHTCKCRAIGLVFMCWMWKVIHHFLDLSKHNSLWS